MRRASMLAATMIVVALILSACAGTLKLGRLLGTGDSGGTFQVPVGSEVVVLVPWPDRPGWMWVVQKRDSSFVRLAGRDRSEAFKDLRAIKGTGGKEALRFKAVAKGTSELTLVYCRFADCDHDIARTATYRIEGVK
jgi:predicted secreted protein